MRICFYLLMFSTKNGVERSATTIYSEKVVKHKEKHEMKRLPFFAIIAMYTLNETHTRVNVCLFFYFGIVEMNPDV